MIASWMKNERIHLDVELFLFSAETLLKACRKIENMSNSSKLDQHDLLLANLFSSINLISKYETHPRNQRIVIIDQSAKRLPAELTIDSTPQFISYESRNQQKKDVILQKIVSLIRLRECLRDFRSLKRSSLIKATALVLSCVAIMTWSWKRELFSMRVFPFLKFVPYWPKAARR